jgi:hypothetical protein
MVNDAEKRIVSRMDADVPSLVNQETPAKRVFRVLTCSGEEAFQNSMKIVVQHHLGEAYDVKLADRTHGSEIIEFVQQQRVDLIVALLGNIHVRELGEDRLLGAVDFLSWLKTQCGIPIFVLLSGSLQETPQWSHLPDAAKKAGLDAFFWTPFNIQEFRSALTACLSTPSSAERAIRPHAKKSPPSRWL